MERLQADGWEMACEYGSIVSACAVDPGSRHLIQKMRQYYENRQDPSQDSQVTIGDFDGTLKFELDLTSLMGHHIYWEGYYSVNEVLLLHEVLKPDMVFVDVGANRGEYTFVAAKRLSNGRVLAFEPVPSNYQRLQENIRLNQFSNVVTFQCGLSDKVGQVTFYVPEDPWGQSYKGMVNEGVASMFPSHNRSQATTQATVEVFDEVFASTKLDRLDIIKIDAEGAELPILRGARKSIERHRPDILLEINEETFNAAGYTTDDIEGVS